MNRTVQRVPISTNSLHAFMALTCPAIETDIPFSHFMTNQLSICCSLGAARAARVCAGSVGGFAVLYPASGRPAGTSAGRRVLNRGWHAVRALPETLSLWCGRPVTPAEISGPFSSSSLPPSLARGRRTADFSSRGPAACGSSFCARGMQP